MEVLYLVAAFAIGYCVGKFISIHDYDSRNNHNDDDDNNFYGGGPFAY